MADFLNTLGKGLGAALTPVAMAMAARSGRDPFDVLRSATGQLDPVQQAQLDALHANQFREQQLFASTPEGQAALLQRPEVARAWGFPMSSIETAGMPMSPGTGPVARVDVPSFPIQPSETYKGIQMADAQRRANIQNQLGQLFVNMLGGGGAASGAGAAGDGGAPMGGGSLGGGVSIAGVPMRPVPSISPSGGIGLSFTQMPAPLKLSPSDINPETQKPVKPGEKIAGRDVIVRQPEPTPTTRTMAEAASKIPGLVKRTQALMEQVQPGLTSTFGQSLMTNVLKQPNPAFVSYENNLGLLTTLVMRMHVGARGGEYIKEHFERMFDPYQPAENINATFQQLLAYAKDVEKMGTDAAASKWFPETAGMNRWVPSEADRAKLGMTEDDALKAASEPAATSSSKSVEALRDRVRALGGPQQPALRRALGGDVPARRMALVGEQGPELVMGAQPMRVQPMNDQQAIQLAEAVNTRIDMAARAAQAARAQAEQSRRLQGGAGVSPLPSSGGGGFQGAAPARTLQAPTVVAVPPSAPLTASQMGGAVQDPNAKYRIEIGPDMVPVRVPIQ